ncbi:MAG: hypothetical protein ACKO9Z_15540 [Planctomycetota bacterium]
MLFVQHPYAGANETCASLEIVSDKWNRGKESRSPDKSSRRSFDDYSFQVAFAGLS